MASNTQRTRVVNQLLQDIRDGKYPVSQKLPSERQLAQDFAVSRPVLREALGMLSTLDVVDIQVGRGAFVIANDVPAHTTERSRTLLDVTDVREALEMGALRLGAVRARRSEQKMVREAMADLAARVAAGEDTAAADLRLHRAIMSAARSPAMLQLWDELTDEIAETIRLSPHGRAMSTDILEQHQALANAVLTGDLETALAMCARMHDDNRAVLRHLRR